MTIGYIEFEFDLPGALLHRLVDVFSGIEPAALDSRVVVEIPDAQGVYQLFQEGRLVYVGKTDAEAGLRKRLLRHADKIQHRTGLDPSTITFRAVRVFVFTAVDLETQLIRYYAVKTWNGSGFGSNDPGRERDTTTYKLDHFDAIYPINIDRTLDGLALPGEAIVAEFFSRLRAVLPYTFRMQNAGGKSRKPHPDLGAVVSVPEETPMSARGLIRALVPQLVAGWQAVKLPSHLILYKDDKVYPSGEVLARS